MFGKMVGLPTRREPAGMFPWSDERPDCVYTANSGVEIVTDVRTCCPVASEKEDCQKCFWGGLKILDSIRDLQTFT